jgi:hypothetical protein
MSVTSKSKSIDLMEFKLLNGEVRYSPKVIYKITLTRDDFLNLFNLENSK